MSPIRELERLELEQRSRDKTLQQLLLESSKRLDKKLAAWRPLEGVVQ